MEKVVIIGSGCAGYTAAIYAARADFKPLLIDGMEQGGQLTLSWSVENFPGFPDEVEGSHIMDRMRKQAERLGTRYVSGKATEFNVVDDHYEIKVGDQVIQSQYVIIATGSSARWLNIPSEQAYKGKGISTCATCDGFFYKDKVVAIVGGGDVACEEAVFLAKMCKKVYLIHRRDKLRAEKVWQNQVLNNDKIEILWNNEVKEYLGNEQGLNGVKIFNNKSNSERDLQVDGVFLAIGHIPNTDIFKGKVELDERGYLKTDMRCRTNLRGVFGAGDVQDHRYKQAITAAASGCIAAMEINWLDEGVAD